MSGIDRFEMTAEERQEAQKLIGQIDAAVKRFEAKQKAEIEAVKEALLGDEEFLQNLAKSVAKHL